MNLVQEKKIATADPFSKKDFPKEEFLDEQDEPLEEELNSSGLITSWQANDFEKVDRHRNWYIAVFVLLVGLVAYALFTDNLLMSILFILFGMVLYLFEKKDPQLCNFGVTAEGVLAQNNLYEFSSLESFWIFYEPLGRKVLSLKSKKKFLPFIHLPLGEADPLEIREILLHFLPETKQEEGLLEVVERLL